MNNYEKVRKEYFDLQSRDQLSSERYDTKELFLNGRQNVLPFGFTGVAVYKRPDGSRICEEECYGGAATGCSRYYLSSGELVGQDYYQNGGVFSFHVFS